MSGKIYTKAGDGGETSLLGGKKVYKHHSRVEAYGTVDELNAFLGLLSDSVSDISISKFIRQNQNILFNIGASLASDPEKAFDLPGVHLQHISDLEAAIDEMDGQLPALKNFILPGGHPIVSYGHLARCVCRRAERQVVALSLHEKVDALIIQYLNRLSDYLFVLSRYLSKILGVEEIVWKAK